MAAAATTPSGPPSAADLKLDKLPGKVLNNIFEHYYADTPSEIHDGRASHHAPPGSASVDISPFLVSKKIYRWAIFALFRNKAFVFGNNKESLQFLRSFVTVWSHREERMLLSKPEMVKEIRIHEPDLAQGNPWMTKEKILAMEFLVAQECSMFKITIEQGASSWHNTELLLEWMVMRIPIAVRRDLGDGQGTNMGAFHSELILEATSEGVGNDTENAPVQQICWKLTFPEWWDFRTQTSFEELFVEGKVGWASFDRLFYKCDEWCSSKWWAFEATLNGQVLATGDVVGGETAEEQEVVEEPQELEEEPNEEQGVDVKDDRGDSVQ